jgi:hypothetical protein
LFPTSSSWPRNSIHNSGGLNQFQAYAFRKNPMTMTRLFLRGGGGLHRRLHGSECPKSKNHHSRRSRGTKNQASLVANLGLISLICVCFAFWPSRLRFFKKGKKLPDSF